jgi:homoserine dehydrogenase
LVVKLLALAELVEAPDGPEIGVRVNPVLVPDTHPLASVRESFNAIFVQGGAVGDLMFYGRGAGGDPTASAVLGDLVDAAVNLNRGAHASIGTLAPARIRPADESSSAYYVSIQAADQPGVLAAVAGVFGEHGVSIASMEQEGADGTADLGGGEARIEFITHIALERDLRATLTALRDLDVVRRVGSVIQVLSTGADGS